MARLNDAFLGGIRKQVFQDRTTTLSDIGRDIPVSDFEETIAGIRADIRSTLTSLPDTAFTDQQAGEGEDVWAAGQIVAHIANSFQGMTGQVRSLLDMEEVQQSEPRDMEQMPDRASALAILDQLDTDTNAFFNALPGEGDYTKTITHPRFGDMDTKGWLTIVTMHENDHLNQMRALGGQA
jgi:hypothetical protein